MLGIVLQELQDSEMKVETIKPNRPLYPSHGAGDLFDANGQCLHPRRRFLGITGVGNTRWHCHDCHADFSIDYEESTKGGNPQAPGFRAVERRLQGPDQSEVHEPRPQQD
jgi:hypothetical protein